MADVAALSVVSSGIVGVLGAVAGFYGQRVALSNEEAKRKETRRDDLRDVLDEAAKVALGTTVPARLYDLTVGEIGAWLEQTAESTSAPQARLGVRVGPDADIYVAYDALKITLADASLTFRALPQDMTFEDLLSSDVAGAGAARDVAASLTDATHGFLRAAAAAAGSGA